MGELTHPIIPPLVSSPVGSDHVLFCSTPGGDSAQGSDVSFTGAKGEVVEELGQRG